MLTFLIAPVDIQVGTSASNVSSEALPSAQAKHLVATAACCALVIEEEDAMISHIRCTRMVPYLLLWAVGVILNVGIPVEARAESGAQGSQMPAGGIQASRPSQPVAQLAPKRYDYDGVGTPDAAMVRRVALRLGVGKTVDVKTTTSKKLRATIQSIDLGGFTVTAGRSSAPVIVPYNEVTQLKPAGLRRAAKIAIVAGLAYGIPWLVWGLSCATVGCGQ